MSTDHTLKPYEVDELKRNAKFDAELMEIAMRLPKSWTKITPAERDVYRLLQIISELRILKGETIND